MTKCARSKHSLLVCETKRLCYWKLECGELCVFGEVIHIEDLFFRLHVRHAYFGLFCFLYVHCSLIVCCDDSFNCLVF